MDSVGCLRLRGLPYQTTQGQIMDFFSPDYTVIDVLITRSEGKPNGQAFVLLPKAEAAKAQAELNNRYLGKRFIEIFASNVADMETARRMCTEQQKPSAGSASGAGGGGTGSSSSQRSKQSTSNLHIIRLRGLPFSATPADIKAFLAPVELPDGINSIQMVRHPDLRPTGEAYVHLNTETEVMQALNKHKQMMGKRYIEVFPSCLAELQQSLTPARPMGYQQADQGYMQAPNAMATADLMHIPMMGGQGMPAGSPAAQAAWLARQQQLVQAQQKMQLQAAAQQKMLSSLQQRQQQQAASLRMHAQLQAQAQALPTMFQQMQLSDVGSGAQQDTMAAAAAQGMMPCQSPQQAQQQQMILVNGFNSPMASMSPAAQAAVNSGSMALSLAGAGSIGAGGAGGTSSSSNMASSMSGLHAGYGLMGGPTPGGLAHTAAAAATAICSPSPLDVQYVPFFCSANSAPMAALMLQDSMGLQPSSLQMFNPSCTPFGKPASASNALQQQQPLFGAEVLSSSANAIDTTAGGMSAAGVGVGPAAFCSDPLLQGMAPLAGLPPNRF